METKCIFPLLKIQFFATKTCSRPNCTQPVQCVLKFHDLANWHQCCRIFIQMLNMVSKCVIKFVELCLFFIVVLVNYII